MRAMNGYPESAIDGRIITPVSLHHNHSGKPKKQNVIMPAKAGIQLIYVFPVAARGATKPVAPVRRREHTYSNDKTNEVGLH
jgi:hypothetical protein